MIFPRKHMLSAYIKGRGIEIGALDHPLIVNPGVADVRYVDMEDLEGLRGQNPETAPETIRKPDIVADIEDLHPIENDSMGFVIACHVLEHTPNPIKALLEIHRVLDPGGILYLSIPDKRYTFDKNRLVTPLAHVIQDFEEGATVETCLEHFREWVDLVESSKVNPVAMTVDEAMSYRIHFHVWVPDSIPELLEYLSENLATHFSLFDYYYKNGDMDLVYILKKSSKPFVPYPLKLKERYSRVCLLLHKSVRVLANVSRTIWSLKTEARQGGIQ